MIVAGVIRGRLLLARRALAGGGTGRLLLGGLLALVLAAAIVWALTHLFHGLAEQGADAREGAAALGLLLTAGLIGLLVFDLQEAVAGLVADSDVDFLRRAPLGGRALFAIKLADVLPRTSMLVAVFLVPAVAAYHRVYPLPAWAWALLPVQLLALWAVSLGAGLAGAVLLLGRVPARRAREALGLVSTLALFLLWLANSFLVPRLAFPDDPLRSLRAGLTQAAAASRGSPGAWAAEAIGAAAYGEALAALAWSAALVAAGALALGGAAAAAARRLERIHAAVVLGPGRRRGGARPGRAAISGARASSRAGVLGALLARDRRLFLRDWTLLGDVVTASILWMLLPLVSAPLYATGPAVLGRAMLIVLAVGLGYEVAARAVPFERHGAWMRLAPVRAGQWLLAKAAGAALVSLPLVLLGAAGAAVALDLDAADFGAALALALPALALALAVGLWTGAAFANPSWVSPRGMLTAPGRVIATLLLVVQAAAWLGAATWLDAAGAGRAALLLPAALAAILAVPPLAATARLLAAGEWRG